MQQWLLRRLQAKDNSLAGCQKFLHPTWHGTDGLCDRGEKLCNDSYELRPGSYSWVPGHHICLQIRFLPDPREVKNPTNATGLHLLGAGGKLEAQLKLIYPEEHTTSCTSVW